MKCVAVALLVLLAGARAQAQTCTVSGSAVAFGNYAPLSATAVTTTGTVTVTCNPGVVSIFVSYTIALGIGGGSSYATRSMGGPSPRLSYQLYRDSAYSQVWGDGTAGTYTVTDGYLLGLIFPITKMYTVYGSIPASAVCGVGSFTDSVLITITY